LVVLEQQALVVRQVGQVILEQPEVLEMLD